MWKGEKDTELPGSLEFGEKEELPPETLCLQDAIAWMDLLHDLTHLPSEELLRLLDTCSHD